MTVLSQPDPKDALKHFSSKGRYSYIELLLQFAADWNVDLAWVRNRIAKLHTNIDLALLFRDIITREETAQKWASHPNARNILWGVMNDLNTAWENVLCSAPDRDQLTLEYLSDALDRFKTATRLS